MPTATKTMIPSSARPSRNGCESGGLTYPRPRGGSDPAERKRYSSSTTRRKRPPLGLAPVIDADAKEDDPLNGFSWSFPK